MDLNRGTHTAESVVSDGGPVRGVVESRHGLGRLKLDTSSEVRAPIVEIRPTSAKERLLCGPSTTLASDPAVADARRAWADMPDARPLSASTLATNSTSTVPLQFTRCSSAASSAKSATRTRAEAQATAAAGAAISLMAAQAQSTTAASVHLRDEAERRVHGNLRSKLRPSDTFLLSLRSATMTSSMSRASSPAGRSTLSKASASRHHAPRSLVTGFVERVRATTAYQPVDPEGAARHQQRSPRCGSAESAEREVPLTLDKTDRSTNVQKRPTASTHVRPASPFHARGEYTAPAIVGLFDGIEPYTEEREKLLAIHEQSQQQRAAVEAALANRSAMSLAKSQAIRDQKAFWHQHKQPSMLDLERLMPGMGLNSRQVDVLVSEMTFKGTKFVSMPPGSPKWTREQRDAFFAFMGKKYRAAANVNVPPKPKRGVE